VEPRLIFITGGARAGKSAFAQEWATALGTSGVSFIATAEALDAEMRSRILRHRQERPAHWETLEEPLQVPQALGIARHPVVLLDCLTLWVSNLMHARQEVLPEVTKLLAIWAQADKTLIVVSNEVGMGIVPENALARQYRDLLGEANRQVAGEADAVYLLVSGIPLKIK
jgi:adenosyl cobinamide kinase/adenosyl cobinamide phosphate guanylyltransferase